jgi:hypothetical protein
MENQFCLLVLNFYFDVDDYDDDDGDDDVFHYDDDAFPYDGDVYFYDFVLVLMVQF